MSTQAGIVLQAADFSTAAHILHLSDSTVSTTLSFSIEDISRSEVLNIFKKAMPSNKSCGLAGISTRLFSLPNGGGHVESVTFFSASVFAKFKRKLF